MTANDNGWIKLWRRALDCPDLNSVSASSRWTFFALVALARAQGKYRGKLVDENYRALTIKQMALRSHLGRDTVATAIERFTKPEVAMLKWDDVKGRRCLIVLNYDRWQGNDVPENQQTVPKTESQRVPENRHEEGAAVPENPHGADGPCRKTGTKGSKRAGKPADAAREEERIEEGRLRHGKKGAPDDIDDESPGTIGTSPSMKHEIRLRLSGPIHDIFRASDSWNGGLAMRWYGVLAASVQIGDNQIDDFERWLTNPETRPRLTDMYFPPKWIERCEKERDAAARRGGSRWAEPPESDEDRLKPRKLEL